MSSWPSSACPSRWRDGPFRIYKELTGFLRAILAPQGVEDPATVRAVVGVRAEVVAQALDEGGGQAFGAQRVIVSQGGREAGHGDAEADRGGHHVAPRILGGGNL